MAEPIAKVLTNAQSFNIGTNGGTIQVDPDVVLAKGTVGISGAGNTQHIIGGGTLALQGSGTTTVSNVIVDNGIYRLTSVLYATANTTPYTIDVKAGSSLFNYDTTSFLNTNYFPYGNTTGGLVSITLNSDGRTSGAGVTTIFGAYLHILDEASTAASNLATSGIKAPVILASTSRFTLLAGTNGTRASTDRVVDTLLGGVSGPGGLIVDGDGNGRLAISTVATTYAGPTRLANGTLRIGMNDALPVGTTLTLGGTTGDNVVDSSGLFELNGFSQTVTSLTTLVSGTANRIGITQHLRDRYDQDPWFRAPPPPSRRPK